ncbi:MAG: Ig-like domain-containing protein [Candidatus Bathyarchaeota archaeon]|nr:Ig-like domain-containing protein [Candidatus Bathyarchaeota archaeon]
MAQCAPSLTVSITNPTAGSTVSGTVPIRASLTNAAGSVSVTYAIDGGAQNAMGLVGDYYEAQWDTTVVADGPHTIAVTATEGTKTAQSSITVTVDNIPDTEKTMSVTVTTDKTTYSKNSFAYITVTVKDTLTDSPLAGAAVTVTVTDPSGRAASGSGTTNTDGIAQFKYRVGPQATTGTYNVEATASLAGYTPATGKTYFTVG